MSVPETSPLKLFQSLENASLGNLLDDSAIVSQASWRGFVFKIEELSLAIPFDGEFEIVPAQELSPLPMTQPWLLGMTNIRGNIYTLIDFSHFIGRRLVRLNSRCNFLLLPDVGLKSGLVLDGRISLRSFSADLIDDDQVSLDSGLNPYLSKVFDDNNEKFGVIDIDSLCNSPEFANIGASHNND